MNFPVRTYTISVALGLCAVFACALIFRYQQTQAAADVFFSSTLRMVHADETVVIRGTVVRVHDGVAEATSGATVPPDVSRSAFRVAYARVLARRDPILGIAGNNPHYLADSAHRLADVQNRLAGVQKTARGALALGNLYPVHFLLSLAGLEDARLAFITSGTDTDEILYRAALTRALVAKRLDASGFLKALRIATAKTNMQFQGFGGVISTRSLQDSADRMVAELSELEERAHGFDLCLGGLVDACDPRALILGGGLASNTDDTPVVSAASFSRISDVRKLYIETSTAQTAPAFTDGTPIILTNSVCLAALPRPFAIMLGNAEQHGTPPLQYVADIFFSPTETSRGPTLRYLAEKADMHYSRINPMLYYMCPDTRTDLSRAEAIRATAGFAQNHPGLLRSEREKLLSKRDAWYESDAYTYVRAALRQHSYLDGDPDALSGLETIALMWKESAAGLDGIVASIARTGNADLGILAGGAPYDLSARTLFLTRSAFPSLFLADGQSTGILHVESQERATGTESEFLHSTVVRYSDIRLSVPRTLIARDLREFLVFEGIAH